MALATLGQYTLLANLGRGGMCDVTLAARGNEGVDFTKLVVIKMLRPEFIDDKEFVTMFLDEARIAARLNHPNVVQTLDVGQDGGHYFLTMEFLDGQPLSALFRAVGDIPLGMRLAILTDVLAGIHYAHDLTDYNGSSLNIVHRDVTPHNVFVTYDGQVKVMDFGIAKAAGRSTQTQKGIIKGKVGYLAPEQVLGDDVDRRTDIFNIGVILYEVCAKARMWDKGMSSSTILRALLAGAYPRSPRERNPEVHEELDRICRKALAFDRRERYSTALEFQDELDAYITQHAARPSPRQVGAFVATHFAAERAKAKEIVKTELQRGRGREADLVEVDVTVDTEPSTPTSSNPTRAIPHEEMSSGTTAVAREDSTPGPQPSSSRIRWLALVAALMLLLAVRLAPGRPLPDRDRLQR